MSHSCAHLGLCQARTPRCVGCDTCRPFPFAPGVITSFQRPTLWGRLMRLARRLTGRAR